MVLHSEKMLMSGKEVTFTVETTPSHAEVSFFYNGQTYTGSKSIKVKKGSGLRYTVTAPDHNTKINTVVVDKDQTVNVILTVDFTIVPTPSTATVRINGVNTKKVTVDTGSTVSWEVYYTGYRSQNGSEILNGHVTKNVVLISRSTNIPVENAYSTGTYEDIYPLWKYNGRYYTFEYFFVKGKSYTIDYTVSSYWSVVQAYTSQSARIDTSTLTNKGKPIMITDTLYDESLEEGSYHSSAKNVTVTFTARGNASYLVLNNKVVSLYTAPTLIKVRITDNS